jgi:hypothetical protein
MKTLILMAALCSVCACKKKEANQVEAESPKASVEAFADRQSHLTYHRIENACVVVFADYSKEGFLAMTAVTCP